MQKGLTSSTLISLKRLTENCITRTGVECLIQALEHNTHMKSIWYVQITQMLFFLSDVVSVYG